jgi:hypothetical protein
MMMVVMVMVVVVPEVAMMMVVVVPPAMMMMVMMVPPAAMVMMVSHELDVRGTILLDARCVSRLHRPQHGDRVGNRIEQLGI